MIKNGTRLRSQVCQTEVIVIRVSDALKNLCAGGVPMLPVADLPSPGVTANPAFCTGSVMGKRYVDDSGAEVLVTKSGTGTLSIGDTPLNLKNANPLPASD